MNGHLHLYPVSSPAFVNQTLKVNVPVRSVPIESCWGTN